MADTTKSKNTPYIHKLIRGNRVKINIRGTYYETYESTLGRYPNTLLGDENKRIDFYDHAKEMYYFDCKVELFDAILFFHQTGILARPLFCGQKEFQDALTYFGIIQRKSPPTVPRNFRAHLWAFLEQPHKSSYAMYFVNFSFLVILTSVASLCVESEMTGEKPILNRFNSIWFHLECFYIAFFTLEYACRMYSSPKRWDFMKSVLGIVDFLAIAPFYLALLLTIFEEHSALYSASFVRILRLIQILRIMKLSRYSSGLRILGKSLLCCKEQIMSLMFFFIIANIFSASVVYLFEDLNNTGEFSDIPSTMWFTVISMTTVGYGDVVPKSAAGKIAATMSIFIGTVILFHLFLPIYLMYFSIFYSNAKQDKFEEKEERRKARIIEQQEGANRKFMDKVKAKALIALEKDELELAVELDPPSNEHQLPRDSLVSQHGDIRRGSRLSIYM